MVSQAMSVISQVQLPQRAQQLGFTPYQVLTIASLVEMEGITEDFGKIAPAAYNRLGRICRCSSTPPRSTGWEPRANRPRKTSSPITSCARRRTTTAPRSTAACTLLPPPSVARVRRPWRRR